MPRTTDPRHDWEIVPNLVRGLQLSGLDQLWVADITYIRLQEEFAYLAVVLDAFSRRVIGWAMADHLRASLAIEALNMALAERRPAWGSLIHHSDRGVQYACGDYTKRLEAHGIAASMSRVWQSLRQRQGRALHAHAQGRGGRWQALSRFARGQAMHRHLHRGGLQQAAPAFGAGLPPAEFEAWHRASGLPGGGAARSEGYAPPPPAYLLDPKMQSRDQ